jgi:hypothetical protein
VAVVVTAAAVTAPVAAATAAVVALAAAATAVAVTAQAAVAAATEPTAPLQRLDRRCRIAASASRLCTDIKGFKTSVLRLFCFNLCFRVTTRQQSNPNQYFQLTGNRH